MTDPSPTPSTTDALALRPGTRVGKYTVVRRLAVGGMAELYLVRAGGAAGFERTFALKRVRPLLASDSAFVEMFLREARLAASLDHPNVARVIDVGEVKGEYFLVMELVHGRSLREVLSATAPGRISLESGLTIVHAAAGGLHHAHDARRPTGEPLHIVHRDVSPSNVLVSFVGEVKVVDFGIAKALADTCQTRGESVKGKIGYMSPEQCLGDMVDRRSDVFALGILLYEVTTGRRLFTGDSQFGVMNRTLLGRYDRPSAVVPGYPDELEAVVLRALQVQPKARYPTARALQDDLENVAKSCGLALTSVAVETMMRSAFGPTPAPDEGSDDVVSFSPDTQSEPRSRSRTRTRVPWFVPWLASGATAAVVVTGVLWNAGARHSEAAVATVANAPAVVAPDSAPATAPEPSSRAPVIAAPLPPTNAGDQDVATAVREAAPESAPREEEPAPRPGTSQAPELGEKPPTAAKNGGRTRSGDSKRSTKRPRKPGGQPTPKRPLFLEGM